MAKKESPEIILDNEKDKSPTIIVGDPIIKKVPNIDLSKIVNKIQKKYDKLDPRMSKRIGLGSNLKELKDGDYIKMPEWWVKATNTPGLPFGRICMLAGSSDSGKTSAAIMAIKAALDQGCGVIYVETEGKTSKSRFLDWGVDPERIILIQAAIAEMSFELMFNAWDAFKETYKDTNLLVVFDSIGNTISLRDSNIDLVEENQKPGGKGMINRLGLTKMVAKMEDTNASVFILNYTYDNIGSVGKTNAGGNAINFYSSLTYQTSRVKWVEKTVNGVKTPAGAEVSWKLYKNHINTEKPGPKEVKLKITSAGIVYKDESED